MATTVVLLFVAVVVGVLLMRYRDKLHGAF